MIRSSVALLALLLSLAAQLPAAAEDDAPAEGPAWRGEAGTFEAALLLSEEPRETIERLQDAGSGELDEIEVRSPTVSAGDMVTALLFFSGCRNGPGKACDAVVDIRVIAPDDSLYAELASGGLWKGLPAPRRRTLQLGSAILSLLIEPHDAPGLYRVEADVRDLNADEAFSLARTFTVSKAD